MRFHPGYCEFIAKSLHSNISKFYVLQPLRSFEGEALYPEIKKFLTEKGFYVVKEPLGKGFSDVVFIKNGVKQDLEQG